MDSCEVAQPRHLPGYSGHQPSMQFRVGATFGSESHNILQSSELPRARRVSDGSFDIEAASTPRRVRAQGYPVATSTPLATRIDRLNLSDAPSTGSDVDRRGGHHLPGYRGHVPTLRDRIGEGFGSSTFTIIRDPSAPTARRLSDVTPLAQRPVSLSATHLPGYSGHVPTLGDRVGEGFGNATFTIMRDMSVPQGRRLSDIGPQTSSEVDERLGRTPGYAGHIPSLRGTVGGTYGRETTALIRDKTVYQGRTMSETQIGEVSIPESPLEPSFMPGYTGHTPRVAERVGETYGQATHELLTEENYPRTVRRMSDITPGGKVILNKQETTITTVEEPPSIADTEAPQPHYVPGYTGFTPQLQYRIGETYGRATHELLLDPSVDHARQLVLSDRSADDYQVVTQTDTISRTRETGTTEPISRRPTIPGFDAFVSRMRGKRGQRFAITVKYTNTHQEITRRPRNVADRET